MIVAMTDNDKGVQLKFHRREIDMHYLTDSEISDLRAHTILGDVFFAGASVLIGAAIGRDKDTGVLWALGILCVVAALVFYALKYGLIRRVARLRNVDEVKPGRGAEVQGSGVVEAKYGANSIWIDVTQQAIDALGAGGVVYSSNELAGRDPIPNVVKYTRVTFLVDGEKFVKDFKEGTTIELPSGVV